MLRMVGESDEIEPEPLSVNERESLMVLLGAGASVDAGVPATFDLTEELVRSIQGRTGSTVAQALNFVCGTLIAYDTAQGRDPYAGLDVERVFTAVELLAERRDLEVTPFVAAWHPAVDHWDRGKPDPFFDEKFGEALVSRTKSIEKVLAGYVDARVGVGRGETYRELASLMVNEMNGLISVAPKNVDYLGPLVALGHQPLGLSVATLNYDLAIEGACEMEVIECDTGIQRWSQDRQWSWANRGVRLLKLHGSIDWKWRRADTETGEMPHSDIVEEYLPLSGPDVYWGPDRPAVVFGSRGKLDAAGPFLSLLVEFEGQLASAKHLLVIGYSFRDGHINEAIRNWLVEDRMRTMTIVDPAFPAYPKRDDFRYELTKSLNPQLHPSSTKTPVKRLRVIRLRTREALRSLLA